jgi:elongation factor P--(R)-beta-lysine ligase
MPMPVIAPLKNIQARAAMIKSIREFFDKKNILEISTPLLRTHTVTDPFIDSIKADTGFLQTSPEYAMKQFIAIHKCDCMQICKAFRNSERGKLHNPEFTILEWYRIGFDHKKLMLEVDELMRWILKTPASVQLSYQEVFTQYLNINPHTASLTELKAAAKDFKCPDYNSKTDYLDFLFSEKIQPNLQQPTFVHSFPVEMALLAKINDGTAERFEWFYQGIELANGFHELNDKQEQEQRFVEHTKTRQAQQKQAPEIDYQFLECLDQLPDCAGVAIGVDRLLLLALSENDIARVL